MKNWEEKFDKEFYYDEDDYRLLQGQENDGNGINPAEPSHIKDFIRRLLEEQKKTIENKTVTWILNYWKGLKEFGMTEKHLIRRFDKYLNDYFDHTPATDKLQISK